MCKSTGCCGSLIRVLLGIINTVFLILGILIIVFGILLKSSLKFINEINNASEEIQALLDFSSIKIVTTIIFVIGAFITLTSIIGLIGACCANRVFLIIYEIIICILFLAHLALLITAIVKSSSLKNELNKTLLKAVNDINDSDSPDKIQTQCKSLKLISQIFDCCGVNGPSDFKNPTYSKDCCYELYENGCSTKIVSTFKNYNAKLIIIPNSVILGFEFLILIAVPFLIRKINSNKAEKKYNPTTTYSQNAPNDVQVTIRNNAGRPY